MLRTDTPDGGSSFLDPTGEIGSLPSVDVHPDSPAIDRACRLCPHSSPTWAYRWEDGFQYLLLRPCNKYSCEVCGPRKRFQLVARIREAAPNRFITLTVGRERTASEQQAIITKSLPKFAKRIREAVHEFEYLRMIEECDDGYPHIHLLARSPYVHWQTILDEWRTLTGSQRIDVRKAHGKSAGYIAKYINKARNKSLEWSRQRMSVTKNFWPKRDRTPREPEWHEYDRIGADLIPFLKAIADKRAIVRDRLRVYWLDDRNEGDDIPIEIEELIYGQPNTTTDADVDEYNRQIDLPIM